MIDLLPLALMALDDPDALPVLGDAILESGWFDPRVMQVVWPLGRAPRNGFRTPNQKARRTVDRELAKAGYPEYFAAFAGKPTPAWGRAVAAVLLFGHFPKRPFGIFAAHIAAAKKERTKMGADLWRERERRGLERSRDRYVARARRLV